MYKCLDCLLRQPSDSSKAPWLDRWPCNSATTSGNNDSDSSNPSISFPPSPPLPSFPSFSSFVLSSFPFPEKKDHRRPRLSCDFQWGSFRSASPPECVRTSSHFGRRLREILIGYFRSQVRTRPALRHIFTEGVREPLLRCDGRGFPIS